jgi:replicative DNA helicase
VIENLITQREATTRSWKRLDENRGREWGLYGHDMGIHVLNMMLGGWIPGKVTTVAARSGIGKTALTVPMFDAAGRVQNGKRAEILFFTWEMESSYLVDRQVCYKLGITNHMLTQGSKLFGESTWTKAKTAYKEVERLPVTYQEMSTNINTVSAIVLEFVKQCKEKEKVEGLKIQPVVIVDYIGMAQFEGAGLRTYGIADFMNGAKKLANQTGAAFCIFAQINRGADEKDVPTRSDISDSQSIEMASDNLVLLHRPEYNGIATIADPDNGGEMIESKNKMLIRVLKGRDFGTGDKLVNCDIKYYRFWDMEHDFTTEYWKLYEKKEFWLKHFGLG